jgi:general secretion pathway protein D
LATENRVNVLATPMILASNNRPASISVAEEVPITTNIGTQFSQAANTGTLSGSQATTEVRSIGDNLLILPRINADRTVTLYITFDSSNRRMNGATIPVVTQTPDEMGQQTEMVSVDTVESRQLQTPVVAKDGMTIAIGGLIRTRVDNSQEKVPVLGDIPYLGKVFRREMRRRLKTELVLLITPHILATPFEGELVSKNRMRTLSDHPYHIHGDAALERYFKNDFWYLADDIRHPPPRPTWIPPYSGHQLMTPDIVFSPWGPPSAAAHYTEPSALHTDISPPAEPLPTPPGRPTNPVPR